MKSDFDNMYILKNNKRLRYGYTTGSCATAASKAAAMMLLTNQKIDIVKVITPKGIQLNLEVLEINITKESVTCAIRKDAGDDPDVTDQMLIYASVKKTDKKGIVLDGGKGIGRVTKKGLEQEVGAAAINKVPRRMIKEHLEEVCRSFNYLAGLDVIIYAPNGEEIAKKTFNERLGIIGGISILGTTGIVEPMSEAALIDSIKSEMKIKKAEDTEYLLVTPGNYGQDYIKDELKYELPDSMKCSNYIGDTIDMAVELNMKGILFISHIGKFIKVAGGIMNTHSRNGDCRAELMASCAILAGISYEGAKKILHTITTDEAIGMIAEEKKTAETMKIIMDKIQFYLNKRSYGRLKIGAIIFSNEYGTLGETENAKELLKHIAKTETKI